MELMIMKYFSLLMLPFLFLSLFSCETKKMVEYDIELVFSQQYTNSGVEKIVTSLKHLANYSISREDGSLYFFPIVTFRRIDISNLNQDTLKIESTFLNEFRKNWGMYKPIDKIGDYNENLGNLSINFSYLMEPSTDTVSYIGYVNSNRTKIYVYNEFIEDMVLQNTNIFKNISVLRDSILNKIDKEYKLNGEINSRFIILFDPIPENKKTTNELSASREANALENAQKQELIAHAQRIQSKMDEIQLPTITVGGIENHIQIKRINDTLNVAKAKIKALKDELETLRNKYSNLNSGYHDLIVEYSNTLKVIEKKDSIITTYIEQIRNRDKAISARDSTIADLKEKNKAKYCIIARKKAIKIGALKNGFLGIGSGLSSDYIEKLDWRLIEKDSLKIFIGENITPEMITIASQHSSNGKYFLKETDNGTFLIIRDLKSFWMVDYLVIIVE